MNENTLVVVHCYAGEMAKLPWMLNGWLHHGCPVLFLSPEDAPVQVASFPARSAGRKGWKGVHTLHRQLAHWKIALEYPQEWFLLNDSDSFCLTADIPPYLYAQTNAFWSNVLCHEKVHRDTDKPNFQPPYFMHRSVLQAMADAMEESIPALTKSHDENAAAIPDWKWDEVNRLHGHNSRSFEDTAAIDAMYSDLIMNVLQIPWGDYPDGTTNWPNLDGEEVLQRIDRGARMLHPIKTANALRECMYRARRFYDADNETIRVMM